MMDKKAKTRRLKMTAWAAFMLPFIAIGASLIKKTNSHAEHDNCHQELMAGSIWDDINGNGFGGGMLPPDQQPGNDTIENPFPRLFPEIPFQGHGPYTSYYEQPVFVYDYFRNLTEHFPTNNAGNCVYTALIMLLCYYDTYWNMNFIPWYFENKDASLLESFDDRDYSSPGVNDIWYPVWGDPNEEKKPQKGASKEEWDDYEKRKFYAYEKYLGEMKNHSDCNLMSYLYEIALNSYMTVDKTTIWSFSQKWSEPTLSLKEISKLLESYLWIVAPELYGKAHLNVCSWTKYKGFHDFPLNDQEKRRMLRTDAIKELKNGRPLIMVGDLGPEDGKFDDYEAGTNEHAVIAYGYDEQNHRIVGHMGWKEKECNQVFLEDKFFTLDQYAYLDLASDVQFTPGIDRFEVYDSGLCSCCQLSTHKHKHNAIAYEDEEFHALQCICGDVKYERHSYIQTGEFDYECEICGKTKHVLPPSDGISPWTQLNE